MNVLMTCANDVGTGGVQLVFRDLVHWLEQTGQQVYLVYQSPLPRLGLRESVTPWGHRAFFCPMPAFVRKSALFSLPVLLAYLPIAIFHLARLIRRNKIDVINCHCLAPSLTHLVIVARMLRVPLVVSVHGADVDAYAQERAAHRFLLRLVMRGADRIVACSEAMARQTMAAFPEVRSKVTHVHNGVNLSHYGKVTESSAAQHTPFILCVCRQVQKKGVDTLLRAFALVVRDVPTMSLVLVGGGPLLAEHQALARALQIEHQVVFMGEVAHAEVSDVFAACTLFVLPSRAEPFGLVLLEAAYHKKGIVCTSVGGVPEIITNGVSGILVKPDDPTDMAAQIVGLIGDPQRRTLLGAEAYKTLMTRFLWKHRIHDYLKVYEAAASARRTDTTRNVSDAGEATYDTYQR